MNADGRRLGARHCRAGRKSLWGDAVPRAPWQRGLPAISPLCTPLTRVWRCWRRAGVSASVGGWRRDCPSRRKPDRGLPPPIDPRGNGARHMRAGRRSLWGDAVPRAPWQRGRPAIRPLCNSPHSRLALLAVGGGECVGRGVAPGLSIPAEAG